MKPFVTPKTPSGFGVLPWEEWSHEAQSDWRHALEPGDRVKTTTRPTKVYTVVRMDSPPPGGRPAYVSTSGPWVELAGPGIKNFIVGHYQLRPPTWTKPPVKAKPIKNDPPAITPSGFAPSATVTVSSGFSAATSGVINWVNTSAAAVAPEHREDFTITLHIKRDTQVGIHKTNNDVIREMLEQLNHDVMGIQAAYNLG